MVAEPARAGGRIVIARHATQLDERRLDPPECTWDEGGHQHAMREAISMQ